MPRYFFNVYDGVRTHDRDGTEFTDVHEARRESLRRASTLLDDEVMAGRLGDEWRIEVTDASGRVLFRLEFIVEQPDEAEAAAADLF